MTKLVLATRNQDKVGEMSAILNALPIQILCATDFPDAPDVDEDQPTLEGNALKKARALFEHTGQPSVSDDTGLFVEALNGRPGVFSARYAGENATYAENRAKMLDEMQGASNRAAEFRTVLALVTSEGEYLFEGICKGTILTAEQGEKGFGYDAIFQPEGYDISFAEMDADAKNAISHRGKAVVSFAKFASSAF
jgi:XTP/dITP diphosphohydrolase